MMHGPEKSDSLVVPGKPANKAASTATDLVEGRSGTDVLLMDDFAMTPMSDGTGRNLLEILDNRHGHRSTLVTSQIPVDN